VGDDHDPRRLGIRDPEGRFEPAVDATVLFAHELESAGIARERR